MNTKITKRKKIKSRKQSGNGLFDLSSQALQTDAGFRAIESIASPGTIRKLTKNNNNNRQYQQEPQQTIIVKKKFKTKDGKIIKKKVKVNIPRTHKLIYIQKKFRTKDGEIVTKNVKKIIPINTSSNSRNNQPILPGLVRVAAAIK